MTRTIEILSPVGVRREARLPLAPRVADLRGKVVGLMDNNKPGGRALLEGVREALAAYEVQGFVYRRKAHPAGPSPYVDEVAARADVVVGGLGD
jgi:hypothetical protein